MARKLQPQKHAAPRPHPPVGPAHHGRELGLPALVPHTGRAGVGHQHRGVGPDGTGPHSTQFTAGGSRVGGSWRFKGAARTLGRQRKASECKGRHTTAAGMLIWPGMRHALSTACLSAAPRLCPVISRFSGVWPPLRRSSTAVMLLASASMGRGWPSNLLAFWRDRNVGRSCVRSCQASACYLANTRRQAPDWEALANAGSTPACSQRCTQHAADLSLERW